MFNNLQPILYKALKLSYEVRKSELDLITNKFKNVTTNPNSPERQAFKEYLLTLDFETIKILKCILYIGREKDNFDFSKPPEINYKEFRDIQDIVPGWNSKAIEISAIEEKLPHLHIYLDTGFRLLNI